MKKPRIKYERVGALVRIYLRGGCWYANYQLNGRQVRESLDTTIKKEARRRASKLDADLIAGQHTRPVKAASIDELVESYTGHLRSEGRSKPTLNAAQNVGRMIGEIAARRRVTTVDRIDRAFVDELRATRAAKEIHPRTIQNNTVMLRQFVNFAISRTMVAKNPLAGLKIPKVKSSPKDCWTDLQLESILKALNGAYYDVFVLWADTGMRFAEAAWLEPKDLDFEHNVILIRPKPGWKPKNGEQRAVPMTARVRDLLLKRKPHCRWVFTMERSKKYPAGDHQLQERRNLAYLKVRLKRVGLTGNIHTFRHSFITIALMAGIPEAIVRDWVGHIDVDVTKLYTHVTREASQKAIVRFLGSNGDGRPAGKESPSK